MRGGVSKVCQSGQPALYRPKDWAKEHYYLFLPILDDDGQVERVLCGKVDTDFADDSGRDFIEVFFEVRW